MSRRWLGFYLIRYGRGWRVNFHRNRDCHAFCLNLGPLGMSVRRDWPRMKEVPS